MAADSLQKYQLEILDLENNAEVAGELGPLQYLSGLTGISMDKIINILLLVIIFVFDPLAISLVVAANFAFEQAYPKKKLRENLYGELVEDINPNNIEVKDSEEITSKKEFLDTLDKIQKTQDEEWIIKEEDDGVDELDLNKDGIVDQKEINIALKRIEKIQNELNNSSMSGWRRNNLTREIIKLKSLLPPEDNLTITY